LNKNKFRLFGEFGFGLGAIKYSPNNSNFQHSEFDALSGAISVLNMGFGVNYYFSKRIGLEFLVPYIRTKNLTSEKGTQLYSGIAPTIGVTFSLK